MSVLAAGGWADDIAWLSSTEEKWAAILQYVLPAGVQTPDRRNVTMSTTHNWNRRGLAGPLCTIMIMAVMGLAALWLARPVSASKAQATVTADAREEIQQATAALGRVTAVKTIPSVVVDKALGVAVFSNLVKAAFIVGGTGGDGVFMRKTAAGGWGAPAFVNLAGASIGAQIGGSKTDAIVFFMDQASIDALKTGKFEFGSAVTAMAGPTSATAVSKTTMKGVYVYARQDGLFAGASASGTTIRFDDEENRAVYGARTGDLADGTVDTPAGLEGFGQAFKALIKPAGSN
jgi:lipid-binding SYLF domain-containing protein